MFIIIILWLGKFRPSWLLFSFVPGLILSVLTSLFLPSSSSVTLSYFILAVPIRECLGKHSYTSSFPIAVLNGTCFFPTVQLQVHTVYSEWKSRNTWCTSKPIHISKLTLLAFVFCLFDLFNSCFSQKQLFVIPLMHEFHIS